MVITRQRTLRCQVAALLWACTQQTVCADILSSACWCHYQRHDKTAAVNPPLTSVLRLAISCCSSSILPRTTGCVSGSTLAPGLAWRASRPCPSAASRECVVCPAPVAGACAGRELLEPAPKPPVMPSCAEAANIAGARPGVRPSPRLLRLQRWPGRCVR